MKQEILGVILVMVGVLLFVGVIVVNIVAYSLTNDVDGWLREAKGAGSAWQMAEFCGNASEEMERLGMTSG